MIHYTDKLIEDYNIIQNNGINLDILLDLWVSTKYKSIVFQSPDESNKLAAILHKIGYEKDSLQIRLQKAINHRIVERFIDNNYTQYFNWTGCNLKSKGFFDGNKEPGTDFNIKLDGQQISLEVKVYKNKDSLQQAIKDDVASFHDAAIVCCYILEEESHWYWLTEMRPSIYIEYIPDFIKEPLPKNLQMCECSYKNGIFEIAKKYLLN